MFAGHSLRWFHKLNWILHTVAFDIALLVTILYWTLLSNHWEKTAVIVNNHALNSVSMILDLFVNNVPERLLHVIYSFMFAIMYITFVLILHVSGVNSSVYPVLNWSTSPGRAAVLCVGAVLSIALMRSVAFGLFKLRKFVAGKTVNVTNVTDRKFKGHMSARLKPGVEEDHLINNVHV